MTDGKKGKVPTLRAKPELVSVPGRNGKVISTLRWNDHCVVDHLLEHRNKWQGMGDLSRVAWGQSTLPGKDRARKKLSQLAHVAADRGEIIVVDYSGPHNRAQRVKIADFQSEEDRQNAVARLTKMKKHRDVSDATFCKFHAIMEQKMATVTPVTA